jgi:hypothetical protein
VVLSLQAILLGTTVGLIGRLLEVEQAGRADLETLRTLDALAEQFRRDINAARMAAVVTVNDSPRGIVMERSADRDVAYEVHPNGLLRSGGRGRVAQREIYRLPRGWTVTFHELSDEPRRMVRMAVFAAGARNVPRLTCDAVLGSDPDVALDSRGSR